MGERKPVHDFPHFLIDDAWVNEKYGFSFLHTFVILEQEKIKNIND